MTVVVADDPMTWQLAEWPETEKASFDNHYLDPGDPDCFVGNSQLFRVPPLIVRPRYVIAPAGVKVPGLEGDRICPFAWLLMPRGYHVVDRHDLPDDWTKQQNQAMDELEEMLGIVLDNAGVNLTAKGGRTIIKGEPLHWHEWLWSRPEGPGLISSGVGPVTAHVRIMSCGVTMLPPRSSRMSTSIR